MPLARKQGARRGRVEGLPSDAGRRHQMTQSPGRHILPGDRESHPDRATFQLSNLGHRNGGKVGDTVMNI